MSESNIKKKYISLAKAAKIYGCTPEHLNLMSRQGKLKAVKIGRNWFTTSRWLGDYKKFVKRIEPPKIPEARYLVSNIRTIYPSVIRKQIKSFFKKTFIISLTSLVVVLLVSTGFIRAKQDSLSSIVSIFDLSSVPSAVQNYFQDIKYTYSNTLKLAKDPLESLVFNYGNFVDNSLDKVSKKVFKEVDNSAESIVTFTGLINESLKSKSNKKLEKPPFVFNGFDLERFDLEKLKNVPKNNFASIKPVKPIKHEAPIKTKAKKGQSFLGFFFESMFDSFENLGKETTKSMEESLASVFPFVGLFDFSEELGGFSEKINNALAAVGQFHQRIVEAKNKN